VSLALASLYLEPTAAQARGLMYADIKDALADNLLVAAYCAIRSAAILGSQSIADDYASAAPENPQQVHKALKYVAKILEGQGYGVTVIKTAIDIEWEGA
jgi:hypothetical protein